MKFPVAIALLFAFVVLGVGCESQSVKRDYMPLEDLIKTEKFKGHVVIQGPVIIRDSKKLEFEKLEGPFRLSAKVFHKVKRESETPFHRCLYLNQACDDVPEGEPGVKYEFIHDDSVGYGFIFVGVENPDREIGVILLKSEGTIPDFFTRNKEKIAREKERWDRMNRHNKNIPKAQRRGGVRKGKGKGESQNKEESAKEEKEEDASGE